jgi:hypothetical protein
MPIIPRTKERPTRYKMLFAIVMEPWESFTNSVMMQPNVQARLPMRAKPPKVELKGWEDNAFKVTLVNLQ